MKKAKAAGGWKAIFYSLRTARRAGGLWRMYKGLRSKNACKTCALGMGGQAGGMVNETGKFPSVCKKSVQAMAADMQGRVRPDFFETFDLAELKGFSPRELEASGRLVEPLYAGPGDDRYQPIEWDEALKKVAAKLEATPPEESFFYFSGRSSNEAGFLLQLFARLYGTNNVNNCSYYCHQASDVGLNSVVGSGTATIVLEDIDRCDLLVLIGANPASNHPRLMRTLVKLRRRGGKVIVVNPLQEPGLVRFKVPSDVRSLLFGSQIADEYIQPHIGGDVAFFSGLAKAVHEAAAPDRKFVHDHTEGWKKFEQHLKKLSWDDIVAGSGVERETIERVATHYAGSERTIFCWAMGLTHHEHGVQNVQAIANLALMRGMVGRPGAGLLPLRGHSNVQGIGSVGVTPQLKDAALKRLQDHFDVQLPEEPGLDTLGCMERAAAGEISFAWCLGGNLYGSNPEAAFAARALNGVDFVVYLSTTLNTGHVCGCGRETLILPVLARDEEPQPTTQESMFNYVRLSDGGSPRHEGPRSEVAVIARIARDVLGEGHPVDFQSMERHGRIREAIAVIVPGYEAIGSIDQSKQEFQIGGRTFHEPKFKTTSGHARFHVCDLPPLKGAGEGELRLMTVRSEGQFNTVVYEEEDIYRGQERRDVIMMHPDDVARLGLQVDQPVTVRSEVGSLSGVLVREIDIRPGNAVVYYPEANVLVPRHADAASRTPAFKSLTVRVEA
ncbi:MAG: FdhF/YdeP family oxidoreductase [Planctomycetota bacterium]|jgi:molybdopterin-dependent oxidoreductase alpha subunit